MYKTHAIAKTTTNNTKKQIIYIYIYKELEEEEERRERETREIEESFACQLHTSCYHFPYMAVASASQLYNSNDSSINIYRFA